MPSPGQTGTMVPTLIRLPGYPLLLALCFRLFGMENYYSAALLQIVLELLGCLLLAEFAARIAPRRASLRAHAMRRSGWPRSAPSLPPMRWFLSPKLPRSLRWRWRFGPAARFHRPAGVGKCALVHVRRDLRSLLRPDGALAAVALAPALVIGLCAGKEANRTPPQRLLRMTMVCVLLALAPFAAWTARNWQVFHVFQPLAPRLATDPGEDTFPGWERWVRTWCLDFVSTYDIYWNVPGRPARPEQAAQPAFDSPAQYAETAALAADYNTHGQDLTPDIDARFAKLAQERIAAHPLRYYLWLPLGRVADMWLRPRVENLNIDLDWWVYEHHHQETRFSWAYAALNALYLLLAAVGLWLASALLEGDARLHPVAQRSVAHRRGAGSPLHPRVLPHALCARRNCNGRNPQQVENPGALQGAKLSPHTSRRKRLRVST
jgi:hypothetical protein